MTTHHIETVENKFNKEDNVQTLKSSTKKERRLSKSYVDKKSTTTQNIRLDNQSINRSEIMMKSNSLSESSSKNNSQIRVINSVLSKDFMESVNSEHVYLQDVAFPDDHIRALPANFFRDASQPTNTPVKEPNSDRDRLPQSIDHADINIKIDL